MTDESQNGRPVSNKDLQIVTLQMDGKLDLVLAAVQSLRDDLAAMRVRADKDAEEIQRQRERTHDLANKVQAIDLRTSPITLDLARDLASMMPTLRRGAAFFDHHNPTGMLTTDEQASVRALLRAHEADERREEHREQNRLPHWSNVALAIFAAGAFFFGYLWPLLHH